MSKMSYLKTGLIILLLFLAVLPDFAEGVTTYLSEGFEDAFIDGAPLDWTKSYKSGAVDWQQYIGDYSNDDGPHGGSYNAMLQWGDGTTNHETWLITPPIDFGPDINNSTITATLEFYHKQREGLSNHQDTLQVYYKRSETSPWILLKSYTSAVSTWTKRTITLPNLSTAYSIGFLGNAKWGFGVCIDDVRVYTGSSGDQGGQTQNNYAVICGVSDYQNVRDLMYCDDDANDVCDALLAMGNWKSENITLLVNDMASKTAIQSAISNMAGKALDSDLCLFHFSGHGANDGTDGYLLPYDSLTDSYDNDISDYELGQWIGALPTDKYVVLLDSCFSGWQIRGLSVNKNTGMGKSIAKSGSSIALQNGDFTAGFLAGYSAARSAIQFTTGVQSRDLADNGRGVVITASDSDEESYEDDALQNGVFTYYLVEGMAGEADTDGDLSISAEECYAYAGPRAAAYTSDTNFSYGPQHAQMLDAWPGELELGIGSPIITKCTVKEGKRPIVAAAGDSIKVRGELGATASDFTGVTEIGITINSDDMADPCVLTFPVDSKTFRNGKFSYSKTINGLKKSFKYDTKKQVFNFSAGKINLTGLNCPLDINIVIGSYSETMSADEPLVNGKKLLPVSLLMGVADSLRVDSKKPVKQNTKKTGSDKLTVKGGFSAWDADVNMAATDVNVILGTQTWTIPQGNFKAKKTKFTCSKIATGNETGIAAASFDFNKGAFTLSIKNADIDDDISNPVNFGINFADVNLMTGINLP